MIDDVDFSDTIWPHGPAQYKGKRLGSIPSNFIKWIAENAYDDSIATDADAEWKFRDKFNNHFWD